MYEPRTYRNWVRGKDLVAFSVVVKETDLYIRARHNLRRKALKAVMKYRAQLEKYIEHHPGFLTALEPFPVEEDAPTIVRVMAKAGEKAGVGPMASVAGTIAECVGMELIAFSPEVIIENGGDIFLQSLRRRLVGVYAGESSFTRKIAIQIEPEETPLGICTSSGTVGHSLSFGRADAAIVLSPSTALADAAATAIGNLVKEASDISGALEFAEGIAGLKGVVVIKGDRIGLIGRIKIVPMRERPC